MIIITGAAGFIGSRLLNKYNRRGFTDVVIVDDFNRRDKRFNLKNARYKQKIHRDDFIPWLHTHSKEVEFIFHLGARTDTTEKNKHIFDKLNLNYSKSIWLACSKYRIPLVYASSAATYGLGEYGYEDDHEIVEKLKPLNPYGVSKNDFDKWALKEKEQPPFWAGLKFFNVYGPHEYHKGRMASVIFHTYHQIRKTGKMKLFRSHRPDIMHGEQSRDFVYVNDVTDVCAFFYENQVKSGLYNLGTGKAKTFLSLAENTFKAMGLTPDISFIDTPEDIRDTYQYFTEANIKKLRNAGYDRPFWSLEEGIADYVKQLVEHYER